MLHFETIEPKTLTVLRKLISLDTLSSFSLVGRTALSLLFGHRISEDLDLFTNEAFDNEQIENTLIENFSDGINIRQSTGFGILGFINEIKVDMVRLPHPLIRPVQEIDGIRMFSVEDIIAMKVQAVLGRGRKKDFWDIAKLLQNYSVQDFIDFHKEKYSTQNLMITVPQAITYFDDAHDDADPISLNGQTWDSVKEVIQEKVRSFLL